MKKIGVVIGRFQGFHLGHIEYIIEAKKRCENLIIGITNYEPYKNIEIENSKDKNRNKKDSNPFSYYERYKIIQGSLLDEGLSLNDFDIVPFPIEEPEYIKNFIPKDSICYLTIYDEWGKEKESRLKNLGFKTEIMWVRNYFDRFSRGAEVREKIKNGEKWDYLVPKFMYRYIKENKIDERIMKNESFL